MNHARVGGLLLLVGLVAFGCSLAVRKGRPGVEQLDDGPASAVLGYVAASFGILVGFMIVFLLGQAVDARRAVGDEATSIGTAFDEAQLFPEAEPDLQHALICYSRAVTEEEWGVLDEGRSSPAADTTYRDLIAAYGAVDEPTGGTLQAAAATNTFVQIGNISTARQTRLVVAQAGTGPILWALLLGGAVLVLVLLFVVTVSARAMAQALLLALAAVFTGALLMLVLVLSNPFHGRVGPVTPKLIENNTERMIALAPAAGEQPCSFDEAD